MENKIQTRMVSIRNGATMKGSQIVAMSQIAKDYSFIAQDMGNNLELQIEYISPAEKVAVDTTVRLLEQYISLSGKTTYTFNRDGGIQIVDQEEMPISGSNPDVAFVEPNISGV